MAFLIPTFWWLVIIFGYSLSIFIVIKVYIFAFSMFKEAPYVPYHRHSLKYAIDLLEIDDKSVLMDVGSGDGSVVFDIVKSTKAVAKEYSGIEISKLLVLESNIKKLFDKNSSKINFIQDDIFEYKDYGRYNRFFLYLTSEFGSEVTLMLLKYLPKNSIIVSADFDFNEEVYAKVNVEHVIKEERGKKYRFFKIKTT